MSPSDPDVIEPDGVDRAVAFLEQGPSTLLEPTRFVAPRRLARRLLFRILRPYTLRQREFEVAVVEALRELRAAADLSAEAHREAQREVREAHREVRDKQRRHDDRIARLDNATRTHRLTTDTHVAELVERLESLENRLEPIDRQPGDRQSASR
jgi:hypothetical protein